MNKVVAPRQWVLVGIATIDAKGKPQFPTLATFRSECRTEDGIVPGIYRLTFNNGYIYIGEACDLQARFDNYCNPTQGTEQEHVLRDIVVDAGGATVEVIPQCDLLPKGITRRAAEIEEQNRAIEEERPLLNKCRNKCGLGHGLYLKFKVEYHRKMVDEAECELKAWNASNPPGAKAQQ